MQSRLKRMAWRPGVPGRIDFRLRWKRGVAGIERRGACELRELIVIGDDGEGIAFGLGLVGKRVASVVDWDIGEGREEKIKVGWLKSRRPTVMWGLFRFREHGGTAAKTGSGRPELHDARVVGGGE